MPELRCDGCGQQVGTTKRTQAVPVQCLDVFCAAQPPISANEERDSFIEHLILAEDRTSVEVGELFGLTRQRVGKILAGRSV